MSSDLFGWWIGIIAAIGGILFAYISYQKNKTDGDKTDGKKDGMVLTELGYIKSGVDDIKRKQEKQDERHLEVVERLANVESSTKSAHKRIDDLEDHLSIGSTLVDSKR